MIVLALIGVAQTSVGTSLARSLGFAAAAERYTELYFNREAAVANATEGADPGGAARRHTVVSFVIVNRESRPVDYHWQLRSHGVLRDAGVVSVAAGATRTVTTAHAIRTGCAGRRGPARSAIAVDLTPSGDAIDYWVACRG